MLQDSIFIPISQIKQVWNWTQIDPCNKQKSEPVYEGWNQVGVGGMNFRAGWVGEGRVRGCG